MKLFTKFHVCNSSPVAPPTGQIQRWIYVCDFWTACLNFHKWGFLGTGPVHDVKFRHIWLSTIWDFRKNLTHFSQAANLAGFSPHFQISPIEFRGKSTKPGVKAYLRNTLICWDQTWDVDSGSVPEDVQNILCPLTTGGRCNKQTHLYSILFSLTNMIVSGDNLGDCKDETLQIVMSITSLSFFVVVVFWILVKKWRELSQVTNQIRSSCLSNTLSLGQFT